MAHATESAHMGWGARQIGAGTAKMTVDEAGRSRGREMATL